MNHPRRRWTDRWEPAAPTRRILIEEHVDTVGGPSFNVYLDGSGILRRLTLDECLGYVALAIVNGRGPRFKTREEELAWMEKYEPELFGLIKATEPRT